MVVSSLQVTTSKPEPLRDIGSKIVLVTGASSGIGREFCIDLAKSGCRIVAAARRTDRLKSLCEVINNSVSSNGEADGTDARNTDVVAVAVAVELDVTAVGPAIEASVQKAWDAFGRIDVLINAAGIVGVVQSPSDISEEDWDITFRTNVTGSWLVSKYIIQRMRVLNQRGSIINISSIAGLNRTYTQGSIAYASSKSSLHTMTKVMAMELGKYQIKVNSIAPGLFKSEITEGLMQKKWLNNVALKTVPLREFGTIDPALTSLVRYLIHDSSDYVTGNIFIVDAGYTLSGVPIYSSL